MYLYPHECRRVAGGNYAGMQPLVSKLPRPPQMRQQQISEARYHQLISNINKIDHMVHRCSRCLQTSTRLSSLHRNTFNPALYNPASLPKTRRTLGRTNAFSLFRHTWKLVACVKQVWLENHLQFLLFLSIIPLLLFCLLLMSTAHQGGTSSVAFQRIKVKVNGMKACRPAFTCLPLSPCSKTTNKHLMTDSFISPCQPDIDYTFRRCCHFFFFFF